MLTTPIIWFVFVLPIEIALACEIPIAFTPRVDWPFPVVCP